jgi:hypothetical protein
MARKGAKGGKKAVRRSGGARKGGGTRREGRVVPQPPPLKLDERPSKDKKQN